MEIAGDSYTGEIASSDVDASVYESHVSHISHASSLHSTTRSVALVPADPRPDLDFTFSHQLTPSDAATAIAAAAGRMLWQQAYHVDYLASSIISHFWRSRKQRLLSENQRKQQVQQKKLERDEIEPMQVDRVPSAEEAIFTLHAAMARAVWRQGYLIDYIASSIIAHTWRNLKRKRTIAAEEVQLANLAPVEPIVSPKNVIIVKAIASPRAEVSGEAVDFSSPMQDAASAATSSLSSTRVPSATSKKAFAALLRASKTGELGRLLGVIPEAKEPHAVASTADEDQLANREALIVTAIASVVGYSTVLPREVVADLLLQSGIFIASAADVIAEHLKATYPFLMQARVLHIPDDIILQLIDLNDDGIIRLVYAFASQRNCELFHVLTPDSASLSWHQPLRAAVEVKQNRTLEIVCSFCTWLWPCMISDV